MDVCMYVCIDVDVCIYSYVQVCIYSFMSDKLLILDCTNTARCKNERVDLETVPGNVVNINIYAYIKKL